LKNERQEKKANINIKAISERIISENTRFQKLCSSVSLGKNRSKKNKKTLSTSTELVASLKNQYKKSIEKLTESDSSVNKKGKSSSYSNDKQKINDIHIIPEESSFIAEKSSNVSTNISISISENSSFAITGSLRRQSRNSNYQSFQTQNSFSNFNLQMKKIKSIFDKNDKSDKLLSFNNYNAEIGTLKKKDQSKELNSIGNNSVCYPSNKFSNLNNINVSNIKEKKICQVNEDIYKNKFGILKKNSINSSSNTSRGTFSSSMLTNTTKQKIDNTIKKLYKK